MSDIVGGLLFLVGVILIGVGIVLLVSHRTVQDPAQWWMWGILVVGILLTIIGILVWAYNRYYYSSPTYIEQTTTTTTAPPLMGSTITGGRVIVPY